jgi:hypothetical protein
VRIGASVRAGLFQSLSQTAALGSERVERFLHPSGVNGLFDRDMDTLHVLERAADPVGEVGGEAAAYLAGLVVAGPGGTGPIAHFADLASGRQAPEIEGHLGRRLADVERAADAIAFADFRWVLRPK